jgi:citrate lyase subunit beta/citryl-CoA lyase
LNIPEEGLRKEKKQKNKGAMVTRGEAGRKGKDVRSDCWVSLELGDRGGLEIDIQSRVESLYGRSIRSLVTEELRYFGVEHANVKIEDSGALPFVLMARLETALKRARPEIDKDFLPLMKPSSAYGTERDRFRRSRLYLPGNEPKFMINAGIHKPDGIILDLEDSVLPDEKDSARVLVRNALCQVDFFGVERMVRINQGLLGLKDLAFVVPHNVHVVLIPKCEGLEDVTRVAEEIDRIRQVEQIDKPVFLMPIVESCLGAIKAYEIASASKNVVALAIGLEDYTADLGTVRTAKGDESFWARSQVVNAARAAGIQPIDTVFSDVSDMEGLRASVLEAKSLGFDGKGCIHPRQIPVIHDALAPSAEEIEKAKRIWMAYQEATVNGLGVVAIGGKMIDPPVIKRAQRTLRIAVSIGKLPHDWDKQV